MVYLQMVGKVKRAKITVEVPEVQVAGLLTVHHLIAEQEVLTVPMVVKEGPVIIIIQVELGKGQQQGRLVKLQENYSLAAAVEVAQIQH